MKNFKCECCGAGLPIPKKFDKYIKCPYCDAIYRLEPEEQILDKFSHNVGYVLIEPGYLHTKAYLEIEMSACINCRFWRAGDRTSYCLAQSHELEHGGWYMHNIKWDENIGYEAQKTWREKTCLLVPVPPHGRLIDVDMLKQEAQKRLLICNKNDDQFQKPYEVMRAIALAPTIIPATKEE